MKLPRVLFSQSADGEGHRPSADSAPSLLGWAHLPAGGIDRPLFPSQELSFLASRLSVRTKGPCWGVGGGVWRKCLLCNLLAAWEALGT